MARDQENYSARLQRPDVLCTKNLERLWAVQCALSDSHIDEQLEKRASNSRKQLGVSHRNGLDMHWGAKLQLSFNCHPTTNSYMFSGFTCCGRAYDLKVASGDLISTAHLTETINLNIDRSK